MWGRGTIVWSPCELEYLRENRNERNTNELSLYLAKSRAAVKRKLDEFDGKVIPKRNGRGTAIGKRSDILINGREAFFRSGWEANVARWLTAHGNAWEYEPEVFFFEGEKRGAVSYCPDFLYGDTKLWLEVKGYLDPKGRSAIRKFKKFHPAEFARLRAVVGSPGTKADQFFKKIGVPIIGYMRELNKEFKDTISNWE